MSNSHQSNNSEKIEDAYDHFKGGCETIPKSRKMLEVVETARTNGVELPDGTTERNAVHVYLKKGVTEVPSVVEEVANKHNLTEVKRDHRYNSKEIYCISYVEASAVSDDF